MDRWRFKRYVMLAMKFGTILFVIFWLLTLVWIGIYKNHDVNTTPQMLTYHFKKNDIASKKKMKHQWVSIDSISQNIVMTALAARDMNFFVHDGFAPKELSDTTKNKNSLKTKTLSQQTADAVFLMGGKSWIHRISETYYTIMIEEFWGKRRILEVYLNTALIGDGVFGVEAASRTYFGKKATDLTRDEAAFIAALMGDSQRVNIRHLSDTLIRRKNIILEELSLMLNIKMGKEPVDKIENKSRPLRRREWKG